MKKSSKPTDSCLARTLFSRNKGFATVAENVLPTFKGFVVTDTMVNSEGEKKVLFFQLTVVQNERHCSLPFLWLFKMFLPPSRRGSKDTTTQIHPRIYQVSNKLAGINLCKY